MSARTVLDSYAYLINIYREFSFMIDRGYSPKVVENFIRIMKEYSEDDIRKAVQKVSKMRPDNPLRHVGYVVGILRKEAVCLIDTF